MFPIKILLVDDEQKIIDFVKKTLEGEKCEIIAASSADEALSIVKEKNFDIYIIDIITPGKIDGIELARTIKEKDAMSEILIMSSYYDSFPQKQEKFEYIKQCEFLSKPFDVKTFLEKIKEMIQRKNKISFNK